MSKNFIIPFQDGEHSTVILKATKPIMAMLKNSIGSNAVLIIDEEVMLDDYKESSSILDAIMEKEYYIILLNHLRVSDEPFTQYSPTLSVIYSCAHSTMVGITRDELFKDEFAKTLHIEPEDYANILSVVNEKQYMEINTCHQVNASPANFTMFKDYKERKKDLEVLFQKQVLQATVAGLVDLTPNRKTLFTYYFSDERIEQPNTDCFVFSFNTELFVSDVDSELSELIDGDEDINKALEDLLDKALEDLLDNE